MSPEEAISPMTEDILKSSEKAVNVIKNAVLESEEGSDVLIVGVGNSCGIPNTVEDLSMIKTKKPIKNEKKRAINGHFK
jgi:hypothetical protein